MVTSHIPAEPRSPLPSYIPTRLSAPLMTVRIPGMFIAGIAAMKNVTVTSAPEIGLPVGSVNLTRMVLLPFCAGEGTVVNSTLVDDAYQTAYPERSPTHRLELLQVEAQWLQQIAVKSLAL